MLEEIKTVWNEMFTAHRKYGLKPAQHSAGKVKQW